jgi:hypothetical protein
LAAAEAHQRVLQVVGQEWQTQMTLEDVRLVETVEQDFTV